MGNYKAARSHYEQRFPELLEEDKPEIGTMNYLIAIDLAAVLQKTGEQEKADSLLNDALTYTQSIQRLGVFGYKIADVDISDATIELKDLLGDKSYTITDLSMCITAREGYLLATRIKQVEGIYMMTGAACPFEAEQKDILLKGLTPGKVAARRGKKKKPQGLQRKDYGAYFFKQYKRIGGIKFITIDEYEV